MLGLSGDFVVSDVCLIDLFYIFHTMSHLDGWDACIQSVGTHLFLPCLAQLLTIKQLIGTASRNEKMGNFI